MQHVVSKPRAPFVTSSGRLRVHQIPVWQDNLVWIIEDVESGEAAVVDGPEAAPVLAYLAQHNLSLTTVFNTHTHYDHIGINNDLAQTGMLETLKVLGPDGVPGLTRRVDEGDEVLFGGVQGRVMRTEGHIDGHVSYVFDDALFCGDTLFAGGCGYLFDGPPSKMLDSLLRLAQLPGGTHVCCAHEYTEDNLRFAWFVEPENEELAARIRQVWALRAEGGCTVPSTIDEERATNPFLRPGSASLLANVKLHAPNAALSTPNDVFAATRALKDTKLHRQQGDEVLPLLF
jgi:hydroxyacylglutathione hydrolase